MTLLTTLYELKGHEEPAGPGRPKGVNHGASRDRLSWLERRETRGRRARVLRGSPTSLSSGAGRARSGSERGCANWALPTIIVERNERPGDSWRKRYKSLCLHDPVWYDHLPYIKFPENWPIFSPKDKIGDWLEMYTRVMELNYWGSSTVRSASLRRRTSGP